MNQVAVFGWLHNSVLDDIQRDDGLPILLWSGRKNLPIFRAAVHFCRLRDLSGVIRNANNSLGGGKHVEPPPLIKSGWGFLEIRVLQNMGGANVPSLGPAEKHQIHEGSSDHRHETTQKFRDCCTRFGQTKGQSFLTHETMHSGEWSSWSMPIWIIKMCGYIFWWSMWLAGNASLYGWRPIFLKKKEFLLPCLIARGQTSLTMFTPVMFNQPLAKRVVKPEFDRDNPERRFCTRNEDFTTRMTRCLPNDQEITMLSLGWAPSTFKRMNLTVVSATNGWWFSHSVHLLSQGYTMVN